MTLNSDWLTPSESVCVCVCTDCGYISSNLFVLTGPADSNKQNRNDFVGQWFKVRTPRRSPTRGIEREHAYELNVFLLVLMHFDYPFLTYLPFAVERAYFSAIRPPLADRTTHNTHKGLIRRLFQ